MTASLVLEQIAFTGPGMEPAVLAFKGGLNVIYGASDTGKSFVLEAVDFMLGGQMALRDIPEREGYDRIGLTLVVSGGSSFTIFRAASGGGYQVVSGVHIVPPVGVEPLSLASKHNPKNANTLSAYLLAQIGLSGRRVRVNARNETNELGFRNLVHLCLIDEGDIQKQSSPVESGQATQRTREMSVFKLLLTGIDDAAAVVDGRDRNQTVSTVARLGIIDEMLATYRDRAAADPYDDSEIDSQLKRIETVITREQQQIDIREGEYQNIAMRRRKLREYQQSAQQRYAEIQSMLARFQLLDDHYRSDVARLEGMVEAGSLIYALDRSTCPLCGATSEHQDAHGDCDGNLGPVIEAARAEGMKVARLQGELGGTVEQLRREATEFDSEFPGIRAELEAIDDDITKRSPHLAEGQSRFSRLVETRSDLRAAAELRIQIADIEAKRAEIERAGQGGAKPNDSLTELPASTLDAFARKTETILADWHFPDTGRVFFDAKSRDFIIAAKARGARGKGLRAITHAAFTIGLLQFCRDEDKPHPGFAVLDSPLLAYREPEGTEDDLTGTDVQDQFYEYLASFTDRQVIIIENMTPPQSIIARDSTVMFTRNPVLGRYGFFPPKNR